MSSLLVIKINNNLPEKVSTEPIDSFQLFYAGQAEEDRLVKLATNKESASNSCQDCGQWT